MRGPVFNAAGEMSGGSLELAALRRTQLLDGVGDEAIRHLLAEAQSRPVRKDATLAQEGGTAAALHVLTAGYAKMVQTTSHGARVLLRYLSPGEPFGLSAFVDGGFYPADVVMVTDGVELQWPARTVRDLIARYPDLAVSTIRTFEQRLRAAERLTGELSNEPVEQRISNTVLRLAERYGRPLGSLVEIPFPVGRQDIADMTGSTLHTVSRVLRAWQDRGIVQAGRQRIAVHDMARLAALAAGRTSGENGPRRTHRRRAARG